MDIDLPTPKRSASEGSDYAIEPDAKRVRVQRVNTALSPAQDGGPPAVDGDNEVKDNEAAIASALPTAHFCTRQAIQRSIALVMEHDGFDSATPEALESYTELVETYLEYMIEEIKRLANSSRREHPIPVDFEATLGRFNLPISSLKPHLQQPLPQSRIAPRFADPLPTDDDAFATLPLLSNDLSGQADKDNKPYIPASFPDFPSKHTYRFTPVEDSTARDSQKAREEAARTAQHGEEALRRLVHASKMRKQKEIKSLVERDAHGKERFRLWESTMRRFMGADGRGGDSNQVDIADRSMIVNGDAGFSRKEVSRMGKRAGGLAGKGSS